MDMDNHDGDDAVEAEHTNSDEMTTLAQRFAASNGNAVRYPNFLLSPKRSTSSNPTAPPSPPSFSLQNHVNTPPSYSSALPPAASPSPAPSRRPPAPPPDPWLNGPNDYTALAPLTLIIVATITVFILCIPTYDQLIPDPPTHFAPTPQSPAFWPFAGRKSEFISLQSSLQMHFAIVIGADGVGKSAFVREYVERSVLHSSAVSVHISAFSLQSIYADMIAITAAVPQTYIYTDIEAVREQFFSYMLALERFILVFDDTTVPYHQLMQFVPRRTGLNDVIIIMHSSTDAALLGYDISRAVTLKPLSREYNMRIASHVASIALTNSTRTHYSQLCEELSDQTAAIVLAGYTLRRSQRTHSVLNMTDDLKKLNGAPIAKALKVMRSISVEVDRAFELIDNVAQMTRYHSAVPYAVIDGLNPLSDTHIRTLERYGLIIDHYFAPHYNWWFNSFFYGETAIMSRRIILPTNIGMIIRDEQKKKNQYNIKNNSIIQKLLSLTVIDEILTSVTYSPLISAYSYMFASTSSVPPLIPVLSVNNYRLNSSYWPLSISRPPSMQLLNSTLNAIKVPLITQTYQFALAQHIITTLMSLTDKVMSQPTFTINIRDEKISVVPQATDHNDNHTVSALALISAWLHDIQSDYTVALRYISNAVAYHLHSDPTDLETQLWLILSLTTTHVALNNNERALSLISFAERQPTTSTLTRAIRKAISATVHVSAKMMDESALAFSEANSMFHTCANDAVCFLSSLRTQSVHAHHLMLTSSSRVDALVVYSKLFNAINDRYGNATLLSAAISLMIGHLYYLDSSYLLSYQSYEESMHAYTSSVSQLNRRTDRRYAHHTLAIVQSAVHLGSNASVDSISLLDSGIHSYTHSLRSSGSLPALTLYDWLGECYSIRNDWDNALMVWREGWMTCRKRLGDDDATSRAWNHRVAAHYARIEKKREDEKKAQLEIERIKRENELKKRADEAAAAAARQVHKQKSQEEKPKSDL